LPSSALFKTPALFRLREPMMSARAARTPCQHKGLRRFGISLALAALLAGCSSGPAPTTFDLSALPAPGGQRGGRSVVIVSEPSAILAYESDRIVVRARDNIVTFLGGAQWADRLPRLFQNRLIQSLENTGRLRSVGRAGDRVIADYTLVGDIRLFEVQEETREAVIEIAIKLVAERGGGIAAAQVFTARAPVSSIDGAGASAALDTALQSLFQQITRWTAGRV